VKELRKNKKKQVRLSRNLRKLLLKHEKNLLKCWKYKLQQRKKEILAKRGAVERIRKPASVLSIVDKTKPKHKNRPFVNS